MAWFAIIFVGPYLGEIVMIKNFHRLILVSLNLCLISLPQISQADPQCREENKWSGSTFVEAVNSDCSIYALFESYIEVSMVYGTCVNKAEYFTGRRKYQVFKSKPYKGSQLIADVTSISSAEQACMGDNL